jgi:hypothetical protein
MEVSGYLHAPAALPHPGKYSGTDWIGGWMGPEAGLDALKKIKISCCLVGIRTPDRPACSLGSIPTKLSRLQPYPQTKLTQNPVSSFEDETWDWMDK